MKRLNAKDLKRSSRRKLKLKGWLKRRDLLRRRLNKRRRLPRPKPSLNLSQLRRLSKNLHNKKPVSILMMVN